ncbi:hypothetical protein GGR53DRAFT_486918 [Hypoxylon sp. FL1150]|nr:hypothetical protein GGR53DRAFT_486918 [Hypoxylon sp. FL1150]
MKPYDLAPSRGTYLCYLLFPMLCSLEFSCFSCSFHFLWDHYSKQHRALPNSNSSSPTPLLSSLFSSLFSPLLSSFLSSLFFPLLYLPLHLPLYISLYSLLSLASRVRRACILSLLIQLACLADLIFTLHLDPELAAPVRQRPSNTTNGHVKSSPSHLAYLSCFRSPFQYSEREFRRPLRFPTWGPMSSTCILPMHPSPRRTYLCSDANCQFYSNNSGVDSGLHAPSHHGHYARKPRQPGTLDACGRPKLLDQEQRRKSPDPCERSRRRIPSYGRIRGTKRRKLTGDAPVHTLSVSLFLLSQRSVHGSFVTLAMPTDCAMGPETSTNWLRHQIEQFPFTRRFAFEAVGSPLQHPRHHPQARRPSTHHRHQKPHQATSMSTSPEKCLLPHTPTCPLRGCAKFTTAPMINMPEERDTPYSPLRESENADGSTDPPRYQHPP